MILFIDTTSKNSRIIFGEQAADFISEKQSIELPARVREILGSTAAMPTAIGVMTGPGSFTGIRLGIAYAKGLAMGYNVPVIGINLFDFTDAQVAATNSGRGDFYVRRANVFEITDSLPEDAVLIDKYYAADAIDIVRRRLEFDNLGEVIPLYIRPSYAEK